MNEKKRNDHRRRWDRVEPSHAVFHESERLLARRPVSRPMHAPPPSGAARAVLVAIAALGVASCHAEPSPTRAPSASSGPSASSPSASAPPSPSPEVDFGAITKKALSAVTHPASAIVLSVRDRKVLGVANVNGGDAANTALRPGSTMKPLLAYSAIDQGITPGKFTCERTYRDLHCHGTHGELDLERAIAVSCNTYFFDLSHTLGPDKSMAALRFFGFGAPTKLMDREAAGHVPEYTGNEEDLEARSMAVTTGHGQLRVTLVQLAAAYLKLATKLTESAGGARSEAFGRVTAGLREAVKSGTGRNAAVEGLDIAGKTGTAEQGTDLGPPPPDSTAMNGWFVGYAPARAPEIVVAVEVTGGGPAHDSAVPIAGEIFRTWFAAQGGSPAPK